MNIRRSILPVKASSRSIFSAIALFIGIVILAWGYYGGDAILIYSGIIVILGGVTTEIVFGIVGLPFKSTLTRRHP